MNKFTPGLLSTLDLTGSLTSLQILSRWYVSKVNILKYMSPLRFLIVNIVFKELEK